ILTNFHAPTVRQFTVHQEIARVQIFPLPFVHGGFTWRGSIPQLGQFRTLHCRNGAPFCNADGFTLHTASTAHHSCNAEGFTQSHCCNDAPFCNADGFTHPLPQQRSISTAQTETLHVATTALTPASRP